MLDQHFLDDDVCLCVCVCVCVCVWVEWVDGGGVRCCQFQDFKKCLKFLLLFLEFLKTSAIS